MSTYELDLFGRVRSLTHAALEQYLAQEQARRSAQLSLIAEVANAYLTLASDRELQRLALQTLESQEHSFELTRSATIPARSRGSTWRRRRPRSSRHAQTPRAMKATWRRTSMR